MHHLVLAFKKKANVEFYKEFNNWPIWLCISFVFGCLTYFSIDSEQNFWQLFLIIVTLIFILILVKSKKNYPLKFFIYLFLSLFIIGFLNAFIQTKLQFHKKFQFDNSTKFNVEALIEQIYYKEQFCQITLNVLQIKPHIKRILTPKQTQTPRKILLKDENCYLAKLSIGTRIIGKFSLYYLSSSNQLPSNYDFQRENYFKKIDAFAKLEQGDIIHTQQQKESFIKNLRLKIFHQFKRNLQPETAKMSASLVIGKIAELSFDTKILIQNAGLSHLFAISGLHMSLISAFFFFLIRKLLCLFPDFALRHNTKKIAAIMAFFTGLTYLFLAGLPISAIRAFFMSSLIFAAILLDLQIHPLRFLFCAAFMILLINPQNILNAGFQMSFMSVFGLITGLEFFNKKLSFLNKRFHLKFIKFFLMIIFSTIISVIFTAPISLHHFGQIAIFGSFANMLAIPLVSFAVMPILILSIFLMPFNMSSFLSSIIEFLFDLLLKIAKLTLNFTNSSSEILISQENPITPEILLLIIISLLIFMLMKSKLKYLSIIFLICAFNKFEAYEKKIIIDAKSKNVLFLQNGKYEALLATPVQIKDLENLITYPEPTKDLDFLINKDDYQIFLTMKKSKKNGKIHNFKFKLKCQDHIYEIIQNDLNNFGTHVISFNKKPKTHNCQIKVTKNSKSNRIWH